MCNRRQDARDNVGVLRLRRWQLSSVCSVVFEQRQTYDGAQPCEGSVSINILTAVVDSLVVGHIQISGLNFPDFLHFHPLLCITLSLVKRQDRFAKQ